MLYNLYDLYKAEHFSVNKQLNLLCKFTLLKVYIIFYIFYLKCGGNF